MTESGSAAESHTYASAGVDTEAGEAAVDRIKPIVRSTYRPEVVGDIGGFGGLFDIAGLGVENPVLVSGTDGVGTKAMVAHQANRLDTIGIDLVAMCVDDIICVGAQPLFFLDYVSVGKVDPAQMEQLVSGIAEGCRQSGCALIGGEMAEHPGAMEPGEFDLVGFAVGIVDKTKAIDGSRLAAGDVLIGLPSPGLRSNGYSLARRLYFDVAGRGLDDPAWDGADTSVADELLLPSVIYSSAVLSLIEAEPVHGIVHVTGGGLPGNVPRILGDNLDAVIDQSTWQAPRIFGELQQLGNVADDEMLRAFNMGIGMVVVVPPLAVEGAMAVLRDAGIAPVVIGELTAGTGGIQL